MKVKVSVIFRALRVAEQMRDGVRERQKDGYRREDADIFRRAVTDCLNLSRVCCWPIMS